MPSNAHLTLTAEDKTQAAFRSLNHSLSGMMQHVAGLKTQLLAIGAVTGFYTLLESAIDAGAEVERLSKTLGASTESLSQFKHVAELAHVPFESLTKGWRLMEKNVSLAALGTGAAKDALQELGISATALKQLKPEDQFATLADALEQVQNIVGDEIRTSKRRCRLV